MYHSSGHGVVTEGPKKSLTLFLLKGPENYMKFKDFFPRLKSGAGHTCIHMPLLGRPSPLPSPLGALPWVQTPVRSPRG
jgi:hypothetical protein